MNIQLKEKLILNRLDQVCCKLAPSTIHGVGVFAIKNIKKGTNPFKNSYIAQDSILVNKNKINTEMKELLNDYHPSMDNKLQIVSSYPNQIIWTNYINYSYDNPNIELMINGEWQTIKDIKKGEEVLENPNKFFNEDGSQKVFTVRPGQYPLLK
jgi:SET domain-containing protein